MDDGMKPNVTPPHEQSSFQSGSLDDDTPMQNQFVAHIFKVLQSLCTTSTEAERNHVSHDRCQYPSNRMHTLLGQDVPSLQPHWQSHHSIRARANVSCHGPMLHCASCVTVYCIRGVRLRLLTPPSGGCLLPLCYLVKVLAVEDFTIRAM